MLYDVDGGTFEVCMPYDAELVDLGLPSGRLWANKNIGACSPTDAGLYFQWGDTVGYTADQVGSGDGKKFFSWDDYKYWKSDNLTKYNSTDNKTVLDLEDDAARANMGGDWRMPTEGDFEELLSETVKGNLIISLTTKRGDIYYGSGTTTNEHSNISWIGYSHNSTDNPIQYFKFAVKNKPETFLCFPAAGNAFNGSVFNVGACAYVWSSSLFSSSDNVAGYLGFYPYGAVVGSYGRCNGFPVRGVQ